MTATIVRRPRANIAPSLETMGRAFEAVPEAIVVLREDGVIAYTNRRLERLCRYRRGELAGCTLDRLLLEPQRAAGPHTCIRSDGACFPVTVRVATTRVGTETFAVCTVRDDTEWWRAEEELAQQAMRDALTGLANRALFTDRLRQALHRLGRSDAAVALLYVDLDWFKEINDEHGHLTGDAVLREVAARLRSAVRPGDTVARLGGDEFVVLCDPVSSAGAAGQIGRRVLRALCQPFAVDGATIPISASVGVAVSWGRTTTERALIASADAALYRAKRTGRGRLEVSSSRL